jgi:hypothetical protein
VVKMFTTWRRGSSESKSCTAYCTCTLVEKRDCKFLAYETLISWNCHGNRGRWAITACLTQGSYPVFTLCHVDHRNWRAKTALWRVVITTQRVYVSFLYGSHVKNLHILSVCLSFRHSLCLKNNASNNESNISSSFYEITLSELF